MLRNILTVACTCGLMVAMSNQASALQFDSLVTIQTSVVPGLGASDVSDIKLIDFIGQVAINGADTDGTPGFTVGDRARVVGGSVNDGITQEIGGSDITTAGGLSALAGGTPFELTAVIQNWDATVTNLVPNFPVPGGLSLSISYDMSDALGHVPTGAGPVAGSGIVNLFIDTSTDHDPDDVNTSADGTWVASFAIYAEPSFSSTSVFGNPPALPGGISGQTQVRLKLIDQLGAGTATTADDFFVTNDGNALIGSGLDLATLISSTDTGINDNGPMTGINRSAADPGPVNIGNTDPATAFNGDTDPFNPPTSSSVGDFPFDLVATFDSNSRFAVVPEPSSMALLTLGLGALGAGRLRRRRKDEEEQA